VKRHFDYRRVASGFTAVSAQYYGQYASDINVSSFAYGVTSNGGPALIVGVAGTSGSYSITLDYGKTSIGVGAYPLYPFQDHLSSVRNRLRRDL